VYISDAEQLATFCERASGSGILAVDTEFIRERTYHPQLCLIQVATADESAAIDPILIKDLSPLVALLGDSRIVKVFHACGQDLEVINDAMGLVPAPSFDTQLAAAFVGYRNQIGYGALVEACCGVHLPKADSLTDWSRRPLDAEQLRYAEDDVTYLPAVYESLMAQLVERDRLSWLLPEMEDLTRPDRYERNPREAYLHLRRAGSLTRKQLAVARELCAWREGVAERRDLPRRWVLTDEVVLEACKRAPRTVDRLLRIRGTEQLGRAEAQAAVDAIARGLEANPNSLPERRRHERPGAQTESVLDLMYALLRLVSERSGVASQLIATRDDLLEFLNDPGSSNLSSGWRYDLLGCELERLLAGETGLTIKDGGIELL
jgi:ribonuclease D